MQELHLEAENHMQSPVERFRFFAVRTCLDFINIC